MSTKTRNLSNIDGANVSNPDMDSFTSTQFESYANDAAFEADHGPGQQGDVYWNTTDKAVRQHNGTAWQYDKTIFSTQTDSTTTGSNQDITPNTFDQIIRFTQGSLVSIRGIVPTNQKFLYIVNDQASQTITIQNQAAGATAANRIITGNSADLDVMPGRIIGLVYDEDAARWRVASGRMPSAALEVHSSDAAYQTIHPGFTQGAIYFNSTSLLVRQYNGTAWQNDKTAYETQNDSTTTGSNQDVTPNTFQQNIRYTQGSLTSIRSIATTNQRVVSLINGQASQSITLKNEDATATAANRIVTGTNSDFTLIPGQIVTLIYDEIGLRWRIAGGAASGSSNVTDINYINDPGAENTASGQQPTQASLYNDGATATPVDGTGGVPAGITFLATATTPIRGSQSFEFSKDAANRQGNGVAFAVTIANPDKGVICGVDFEMVTSVNYVSGDLVFYVYDVTNSVLITPRSVSLPKLDSYGKFFSDFGFTTGTSYRIIFHVATTSALAYSVKFDTIRVSTSRTAIPGAAISEWQSYTPTFSAGVGTASTINFWYRRVGSDVEIQGSFATGTVAASTATFTLPTGLTIGSTAVAVRSSFGEWYGQPAANTPVYSTAGVVIATTLGATTLGFDYQAQASSSIFTPRNGATLFNNNAIISIKARVPIAEWAGNGTVNLGPGAQVEYAYNSGTWNTASETSSFAFGPGGALMGGALGQNSTKRVRFNYPIQTDDQIVVEVSEDRACWVPVNSAYLGGNPVMQGISSAGTSYSGVGWTRTSGTTTDIEVVFGSYQNFANDDAPTIDWPSTAYWRVRKARASAPVGFGLAATDGSSGLVNPYIQGSGVVYAGTYTPTPTNGVNTSASAPIAGNYTRVGNQVTVHFQITATNSAAGGTLSIVEVALPVASNLTSANDVNGVGTKNNSTPSHCVIYASVANDRAVIQYNCQTAANESIFGTFQYTIK